MTQLPSSKCDDIKYLFSLDSNSICPFDLGAKVGYIMTEKLSDLSFDKLKKDMKIEGNDKK